MRVLCRFRKNLILHGFLAQHPLQLAHPPFLAKAPVRPSLAPALASIRSKPEAP
jgi:hypothetical protein